MHGIILTNEQINNMKNIPGVTYEIFTDAFCNENVQSIIRKKSMSDYHEGLEEGIKIGMAESAAKIEKLREAIEMADKRKGRSCFYFSGSRSGRISWADWFYIREKGQ